MCEKKALPKPGQIRLIACDIDGTLLPFGAEHISEANKQAIAEARARGIAFILATGRQYGTAMARIAELNADDLPVIASSGADVRVKGKTVKTRPMDDSLVADIVADLQTRGVPQYLFCGDDILCTADDTNNELFAIWRSDAQGRDPVRVLPSTKALLEAAHGRTEKMLAFVATEEQHDELLPHMTERYSDKADIACGGGLNLEMISKDATKAAGLETVCELLDIPIEKAMAIGDSGNDIQMLQAAGLGVAVADGMEEARQAADAVVASSSENGAAQAIRRYALGEDV